MHDTKERLSLFWLFALLNYLYADCTALFAIVGSPNLSDAPHFPPWVLLASSVFMEIPIAMIVACRLLPFRANRLANIIAGGIVTLINGFLTFVPPLIGWGRPPRTFRKPARRLVVSSSSGCWRPPPTCRSLSFTKRSIA